MKNSMTIVLMSVLSFVILPNKTEANSIPGGTNLHAVWIFFKDKPAHPGSGKNMAACAEAWEISPKAMKRRNKSIGPDDLVDWYDQPVDAGYQNHLRSRGIFIRVVSRWLNAVSAEITPERMAELRVLSFVRDVKPVSIHCMEPIPESSDTFIKKTGNSGMHRLEYGPSEIQNDLMAVPEVHDLQLNGAGVLIGMIDTGFDTQEREVFSSCDVVAEYDFHWNDSTTANEEGDSGSQHNHGTETLSVIAGLQEGQLVGPAYGASYALAKTEWVSSETQIEEDHWVAGIEWLERLGVDIVSSSLGYNIFNGGIGYDYENMDGNTCVTTLAADIAVKKGVCVFNSVGNERTGSWHYLIAPADGDSVIAVGAVSETGELAAFSSSGPSSDGQIKPDVVAMGVSVVAVNPNRNSTTDFVYVNGTSFSCPLAAGVGALVLQAHPELNPMEIRDALRQTAEQQDLPNNDYGWGLINAKRAVFYHGMIFRNFEMISLPQQHLTWLDVTILSNDGLLSDSVFIFYRFDSSDVFHRSSMDHIDQEPETRYRFAFSSSAMTENIEFYFETMDSTGRKHAGPVGAPQRLYTFSEVWSEAQKPVAFVVEQNYPNPFNQSTTIYFEVPRSGQVSVTVYDILGKELAVLFQDNMDSGKAALTWDGNQRNNTPLPSGIYLAVIRTKDEMRVLKMTLLR